MTQTRFADIILPLAVKGKFTYIVPDALQYNIVPGCRVIVQFGARKLYSGIVSDVYTDVSDKENLKEIIDLIDSTPVVNEKQIALWKWMSDYYMCTPGEVMKAALPSGLSLESETRLTINHGYTRANIKDEASLLILNLIENQGSVVISALPRFVGKRSTYSVVNRLIGDGYLQTGEAIREGYKPREETFIVLAGSVGEGTLNAILDSIQKAPRQYDILTAYLRVTGYTEGVVPVPLMRSVLLKEEGCTAGALNTLIKKGVLENVIIETGRLAAAVGSRHALNQLSEAQAATLQDVKDQFADKDVVLLHGVTSGGKTEVYIHLIEEQLKKGRQVLYMLPEIALTSQIIERLRHHFGPLTGVYHSRFSDAVKVEIWNKVNASEEEGGYRLLLGVRSSLFLPFSDLGLIIVDEEHDGSYKQQDPSPRYNARDCAIVLAGIHDAKVLLGSATPSVESYFNATKGKYGLTELKERFGNVRLPEIILADTREAYRRKKMVSHFTPQLLGIMDAALGNGEQIALFQNRRGFSPFIECADCGWVPGCSQCAVKLTYHKGAKKVICHYCGHTHNVPHRCDNCGSSNLVTKGFGTEKIEDEVKIVFPQARVARMDQDTTRKKDSFNRIIRDFENRDIDILIGTQMISKGLDFENLTVVGVLNADSMLNYPDFRAYEKSYQMIEQVSGRAGRRSKQGKVVIQTSDPANNIIRFLLSHNYTGMYTMQLGERELFMYPPFCRLIRLNIRHKEIDKLNALAGYLANSLKKVFGNRVLGPEAPVVGKVQLWYIKTILIKIERRKPVDKAKLLIDEAITDAHALKGFSNVRIAVDVDPL